jgi:hypothetical protein
VKGGGGSERTRGRDGMFFKVYARETLNGEHWSLLLQFVLLESLFIRRVLPQSQRIVDDDPSFIVLTETKFSFRCIPVWDRYSPHRTRVEKKHM